MFIDKEGKDRFMCEDEGQGYAEEADSMAIMMTTGPAGDLKKTPGGKVSVRLGSSLQVVDVYVKLFIMKKIYFHLLVIAMVGLIAYSNSFNVPFQFDDLRIIPIILS